MNVSSKSTTVVTAHVTEIYGDAEGLLQGLGGGWWQQNHGLEIGLVNQNAIVTHIARAGPRPRERHSSRMHVPSVLMIAQRYILPHLCSVASTLGFIIPDASCVQWSLHCTVEHAIFKMNEL
jgi:hypothetical protein